MPTLLSSYPYRKRRDLRSAMGETLVNFVRSLQFDRPFSTAPFGLRDIYYEWPVFEKVALSAEGALPAGVLLPDTATEEDSQLTPSLIEDTWMSNGIDGYGLFKISEKVVTFLLVVRAASKPQRQAIVSGIEDAFAEAEALRRPTPLTYGRLLQMDSYYQRKARFTLLNHRLLDQAQAATESRYLCQFEIQSQAPHVLLRRVPAMDPRVEVMVDPTQD